MGRVALLALVMALAACGQTAASATPSSTASATTSPTTSPSASATASPTSTGSPSATPVVSWSLTGGTTTLAAVADIRVGGDSTRNRVVIEFGSAIPTYKIEPNESNPEGSTTFTQSAKGTPIVVDGSFGVHLQLSNVNWTSNTYLHGQDLKPEYAVVKEVEVTGSFEGITDIAIGLSRNTGAPTITLMSSPPRLVIDFPAS